MKKQVIKKIKNIIALQCLAFVVVVGAYFLGFNGNLQASFCFIGGVIMGLAVTLVISNKEDY